MKLKFFSRPVVTWLVIITFTLLIGGSASGVKNPVPDPQSGLHSLCPIGLDEALKDSIRLNVVSSPGDATGHSKEEVNHLVSEQPIRFLENKGQMMDTKKNPVPFVLFRASSPGMNVYVTEEGLTYMFVKTEERFEQESEQQQADEMQEKIATESAWINLHLEGATIKKKNIIQEGVSSNHSNYFYPHCPDGIYGIKQYEKITIINIYPGIDWLLYGTQETGMKYDFIVHAGADPHQIKLVYESEQPISINTKGDLELKSRLGQIIESAPYSYLQDSKITVPSKFLIYRNDEHNVEVTFTLTNYNGETLVIDPQLWWGTMYGGTTDELDGPGSIDADNSGNLLVAGYTTSPDFPVMNAGTYYDSVYVGGVYDLFLMKFNNNGVLLWSSYYGGNGDERSTYEVPFITHDAAGNIFIVGQTFSEDFPVQNAGTYFDSTFNGSWDYISDAFILKFDSSGNRTWATYFGGDNQDRAISAAINPSGNLFVTGFTNSSANFPLQSGGSAYFDSTFNGGTSDMFISKFSNTGDLIWSTYYGGSGEDHGISVTADAAGNVFLTGETFSADFPLQNNSTYYDSLMSGTDAFMLKFDTVGNLIWSTFYGGTAAFGVEWGLSLRCDHNSNVFVMGYTNSTDFPLLNAGTYFDSIVGFAEKDMFISKFDNAGTLLWSTFYGGAGNVNTSWDFITYDNLEIDTADNVYISFNRGTDATPTHNPGCNSFCDSTAGTIALAEFSNAGMLLWGTYIGNGFGDFRCPIAIDKHNDLFIGGEFNNYSSAAGLPLLDPGGGAYYSTLLGPNIASNHQAFQLKFIPDSCNINVPSIFLAAVDTLLCEKFCTDYIDQSTNNPASWQWFFPGGNPSSSTDQNPTNICYNLPGTYDVTLITTGANGNDTLTLHNYITVYPTPPIPTITQAGYTLTSSSASSYQWQFNAVDISGATNQSYTVLQTGYYTVVVGDTNGCKNSFTLYVLISGINEAGGDENIYIFPNPASDELTIDKKQLTADEIEIKDVAGRNIYLLPFKAKTIVVDVRGLPSGIYFVMIRSNAGVVLKQFVKQ
ncbi:MAG TPA: SBBP repeat-containing protein [Chitinophagales bacterium]|nr:SBBP repeat-containing protein [Chitinophagales bacterium]